MFNIGYLKSSGSFNNQCQYPSAACMLSKSRTQSYILTDPIIAEHGEVKTPGRDLAAECIKTRPRKEVFHDRFSTSFLPMQISSAYGFFTVNAFIHKVYHKDHKIAGKKVKPLRQETAQNSKEEQYE